MVPSNYMIKKKNYDNKRKGEHDDNSKWAG
jgi:hypothetical protein